MTDQNFGRRDSDKDLDIRMSIQETRHNHLESRVGKMEGVLDTYHTTIEKLSESVNGISTAIAVNAASNQQVAKAITDLNTVQMDVKVKVDVHEKWRSEVIMIWVTMSKVAAVATTVGAAVWAIFTFFKG